MGGLINKSTLAIFKPMLRPGIEQGQKELKKYLDTIPLDAGETDCRIVSEFTQLGQLVLIVATFKGREFSRVIGKYTGDDLINLIEKVI